MVTDATMIKGFHLITNSFQCCPHIETSQLICLANQLTDCYMRATLAFNGLKLIKESFWRAFIMVQGAKFLFKKSKQDLNFNKIKLLELTICVRYERALGS